MWVSRDTGGFVNSLMQGETASCFEFFGIFSSLCVSLVVLRVLGDRGFRMTLHDLIVVFLVARPF